MSFNDPVADFLTRIRNGQMVKKTSISMPSSIMKEAMAKVLHAEGYINEYKIGDEGEKKSLTIKLKYYEGQPVIQKLTRISRPGLRVYKPVHDLPKVIGGLGIAIISTSYGIMTDHQARKEGHGGEILCTVE